MLLSKSNFSKGYDVFNISLNNNNWRFAFGLWVKLLKVVTDVPLFNIREMY